MFSAQDEGMTIKDSISDKEAVDVEEALLETERLQALTTCIKKLGEREQLILSLYYTEELTLKEIAEILEISIPRVSQIHGKMVAKLRLLIKEELA